jgi:hypothetical protein
MIFIKHGFRVSVAFQYLILSIPDEGYSRNVSWKLNLMSKFLFHSIKDISKDKTKGYLPLIIYAYFITGYLPQYVQPCLLKNPKYTFYTIKSSLKLAYN